MKRFPVKISKDALSHMRKMVNSDAPYLLIGTKGGGCNGLKYYIESIAHPEKLDVIFKQEDINVAICGKSLLHLFNTRITWKVDALGARLEFENPNASSTCGCGETFSL